MPCSPVVLVINCGSSSLKFSVIECAGEQLLLSGLAEKIGTGDAFMTFRYPDREKQIRPLPQGSHSDALTELSEQLKQLQLLDRVMAIGHRVAHGGSLFSCSALLDSDAMEKIRSLCSLAPLHNPANITGIEAAEKMLPGVPQVAVFDTAFHQTLPAAAYTYAIPLSYREQYQVRKYGFHGTSHRYIAAEAVSRLDLNPEDHGIIVAHLGNGSSVCAVQNGSSRDTSMGMTPLEGLVMGTRSGDIDFGAVAYIAEQTGRSMADMSHILNRESGLLGLSGISGDLRQLQEKRAGGDAAATLAVDVMVHRLARHIGAHMTSLSRLDALIFTGGIGENSALIRDLTVQHLKVAGFVLDSSRNQQMCGGRSGVISASGSPLIAVIPTDEEIMIARDTRALSASTSRRPYLAQEAMA